MSRIIFLPLVFLLFAGANILFAQNIILKAGAPVNLNRGKMLNVSAPVRPVTLSAQADLIIVGWDYKPEWGWGCSTEIDFCEYNCSTDSAGKHRTQIYLSEDLFIDSTDIKFGEAVSMGTIAPDYFQWGKVVSVVPALTKGLYHIGCIVDVENQIPESDENNTFYLGTINITDALPDLIAISLEIPGEDNWTVGSDLTFSITEGNTGHVAAGEHTDQLCLIDIFNNIVPIAEGVINSTAPEDNKIISQTVKIPYMFNRDYNLGIVIDSKNEISECSEENIYQLPGYSITISGGQPKLTNPLNGLKDLSSLVQFEWLPFQNPDATYMLQISDDSSFTKILFNVHGIAEPYYKLSGLQNNMKYYWRVAARPQIGNYSPWSEVWNFSTVNISHSVTINSAGSGFGKVKINGAISALPFRAFFNPNDNISLEAVAEQGSSFAGWSGDLSGSTNPIEIKMNQNWSISANFNIVLATPDLTYPANNSCYIPTTVELSWTEVRNATLYHLQVSADSSFSILMINDSLLVAAKKTADKLLYKRKYYWRTRAGNSGLYSSFSEPWCFTTNLEQIPAPGNLTAKLNNSRVELSWSDNSKNETEFKILRRTGDSTSVDIYKLIGSTVKNVTIFCDSDVVLNQHYFYKIYAVNEDTVSAFSNLAEIKITTSVSKVKIPENLEVYQNYPNPFNSETIICFEIPEQGNVRLSVVDLLGREVSLLLNEEKDPGKHTVKLDAKNLTSGQYFLILQSGSHRAIKKMTVMK